MDRLLYKIRVSRGLSQQEFADILGVSFATINRWENKKAVPNKLAQLKIYDFCKEMNIPVYDMVMDKIHRETEDIIPENNRKILFHGSKCGLEGKIAPISRSKCDFGSGFYMGSDPAQSLTLISGFKKSRFYIVSLLTDGLNVLDISPDINWALTIAFNRGKMESIKGSDLYKKYFNILEGKDLVIGSIADDRMFYVLEDFFHGKITSEALVKSLSALDLGKQYVTISGKGCDNVRIEKEIRLSYLERKFIEDRSEENREKGIAEANEICKEYRRQGLFFDEILVKFKDGQ